MAKSAIFWAEPVSGTGTKEWCRYPLCRRQVVSVALKVVPVPIGSRVLVPALVQVVPGTDAFCNSIFACYALLSPVFVHRLFKDPNK